MSETTRKNTLSPVSCMDKRTKFTIQEIQTGQIARLFDTLEKDLIHYP